MSPADWQEHFGSEVWRRLSVAKKNFDPNNVLTPGRLMGVTPTGLDVYGQRSNFQGGEIMQKLMRVFTAVAALGLIAIPAAAQYPSKAIRIVVPFAAGGTADAITRLIAQPLSETLGQPVVV